jgi:hypothetical protein
MELDTFFGLNRCNLFLRFKEKVLFKFKNKI